jgi:hypothetical protein
MQTSWKESFRLVKSSWVQSVLSAQASLMHRYQVRKRVFLRHSLILRMVILPRQARDKHRESTQKHEMHRYQRYCFKVSEVKVFLEDNW